MDNLSRLLDSYCDTADHHLEQGRAAEAAIAYSRAIDLDPDCGRAHFGHGNAQLEMGEFSVACESFAKVIEQYPQLASAHFNMAIAEASDGRLEQAIQSYRQAIRLDPRADYYNNLGTVLGRLDRYGEAEEVLQSAVSLDPQLESAHTNLAHVYVQQGDLGRAIDVCHKALALNQRSIKILGMLADCWLKWPLPSHAIDCLEQALRLDPDRSDLFLRLGVAYYSADQLQEAARCYQEALRLSPSFARAHSNLGEVRRAQGRIKEALDCQRQALRHHPDLWSTHSNLLFTQLYEQTVTPSEIRDEAFAWARRHTEQIIRLEPRTARPATGRRLKIGYVSADFRRHPVGYFIGPVLKCHDRDQFEVHCYADPRYADDWTKRLRELVEFWTDVDQEDDDELAQRIHRDEIEILVDLTGHTSSHRLLTFAHKPARVQVTWMGFSSTTGLAEMDYILADRWVIPRSEEVFYSEKVFRLPTHYLCCAIPDIDLETHEEKSGEDEPFTFGCFNNRAKLTPYVIQVWAEILSRVAGSRLFLKTRGLGDEAVRIALSAQFAEHGVAADRLLLAGHSHRQELLAAYRDVDLCLDPFPFNGGITTFEALWMGVPVLTVRGDRFAAHAGESFLAAVGLEELVAGSPHEYRAMAYQLAGETNRLRRLRANLRQRLLDSPLCDYPSFARGLEKAYRQMWRRVCEPG